MVMTLSPQHHCGNGLINNQVLMKMKFFFNCSGYDKIVEILLKKGANKEHKGISHLTPLHGAVRYGNWEILRIKLNILFLFLLNIWKFNLDRKKAVEILIREGANMNCRDGNMETPVHLASKLGNWKCRIVMNLKWMFSVNIFSFDKEMRLWLNK